MSASSCKKKKCSALKCNICVPKCELDAALALLEALAGSAPSQAIVKSYAAQDYRIKKCGVKEFFGNKGPVIPIIPYGEETGSTGATGSNEIPLFVLQYGSATVLPVGNITLLKDSKLSVKGSVKGGKVTFLYNDNDIVSFSSGQKISIDQDLVVGDGTNFIGVGWEQDPNTPVGEEDLSFLMIVQTCAKEFEKCWTHKPHPKPCHKPQPKPCHKPQPKPCHKPCDCCDSYDF